MPNKAVVEKKFQLGGRQVSLQTGLMARQATASVVVRQGDAAVLVTLVVQEPAEQKDFLALSVHYQERAAAYGKIPTTFKRREGPPSEREVLTSRLIDRPMRPLFPEDYGNEVQVVCILLSSDPTVETDMLAMIGAASVLRLSGLPVSATFGGVRVGMDEEGFTLNPIVESKMPLDLIVAGTSKSLLMVESSAAELPENRMIEALEFAHENIKEVITAIDELANLVGTSKPDQTGQSAALESWNAFASSHAQAFWEELCAVESKAQRGVVMKKFLGDLKEAYLAEHELSEQDLKALPGAIKSWKYQAMRAGMFRDQKRVDGRAFDQIRPIACDTGVFHGPHGSALFTRGETQSLASLVLGTGRDAQTIENHDSKEQRDFFMLHYNFPPFSVGEINQLGSPKRREIGHGRLAKRAIESVLPSQEDFPYVLRAVSDILECNGSSSMATICSTSLALMDAGVPIKSPVAGIAMGLLCGPEQPVVLSDILGEEDALGDMDFKLAGTASGITALQMDIKDFEAISFEVIKRTLEQARVGRLHILSEMNKTLEKPRAELASNAPHIDLVKIKPEQIREVIGKGGATVKLLSELSGATFEISDDGSVNIVSYSAQEANAAKGFLKQITDPLTVGNTYLAQVTKLLDFGFVVSILSGKDGLVHISECPFEDHQIPEKVSIGQRIEVRLVHIDRVNARLKFSLLKENRSSAQAGG